MNLFLLDQAIVYIFLLATLILGMYSGRGVKTVRDYAIADKSIGILVITVTIMATSFGSGDLLGSVEEVANKGFISTISRLLSGLVGISLIAYFIAPKFLQKKYSKAISISDIISYHYGKGFEIFSGIMGCLHSAGILGIQITAMGYILDAVFNLGYEISIIFTAIILVTYSAFGGIKAVSITDGLQFFMLITIIPVLAILTMNQAGGFELVGGKIIDKLTYGTPKNIMFDYTLDFIIEISTLTWLFPAMVQRFLMANHQQEIKKGLLTYAIVRTMFLPLISIMAFAGAMLYPQAEAKEVIATIVNNSPTLVKGLAIAGIIAMIMSTADSFLNAGSILLVHNVLQPLFKIKKELSWMIITTFFIGMGSILVALNKFNIIPMIAVVDSLWVSCVIIPLMAGLFNFKTSKICYVASIISGVSVYIAMQGSFEEFDFIIPFSVICSSIAAFLLMHLIINGKIAFIKEDNDKDSLEEERVGFFISLKNRLEKTTFLNSENYRAFCIFFWVNSIVCLGLWLSNEEYVGLGIIVPIVITGMLSIILASRDAWSPRYLKYYNGFWFFTLTVCLPIFSSILLFSHENSSFAFVNFIINLLILAIFVDWLIFLAITLTGVSLGYYYCYTFDLLHLGGQNYEQQSIIIYSAVIIVMMIFSKRFRESVMEQKLQMLQMHGGAMAHEVKTPLSSSQISMSLIDMIINEEATITKEGAQVNLKLSESSYEALQNTMKLLQKANKLGQKTVDMLLMSMKKGGELQGEKQQLLLSQCLDEALEEYGFNSGQREKIEIEMKNDIKFIGDKENIKHIIFNLIKNAFRHGGAEIDIKITINKNILRFRDNGNGIPAAILSRIFDEFYIGGSQGGTGLGLSFCKKIMKGIGGNIKCRSEYRRYTEFILIFPE